jgi:hypothetical protein
MSPLWMWWGQLGAEAESYTLRRISEPVKRNHLVQRLDSGKLENK